MDLNLIHPATVVISPDIVITTPTTVVTMDQRITYFEFFLKPGDSNLGSPTLISNFKEINIVDSAQISSNKLSLTLVSSKQIIDSFKINANKSAEYFWKSYIEEVELIEYFRSPNIEDKDKNKSIEYFRPSYIEVNTNNKSEAYFREAFIENDSVKLMRSIMNWLEGLHSPATTHDSLSRLYGGSESPTLLTQTYLP